MKKPNILFALPLGLLALSACSEDNYDYVLDEVVTPDQIDIEVFTDQPGSNMVILKNNTPGVIPSWHTSMGDSKRQCDTIIAPCLGEFTVEFTGWAGGGPTETVTRSVKIEKMTYPTDEWYSIFAGTSVEGKKWVWDPNPGRGSWGPYGSGGYGYSPDVPNWGCYAIGEHIVYSDEYLVFDLNGGANVTYYKHDGTTEKGSFAFKKGISGPGGNLANFSSGTPSFRNGESTGLPWVGTLTIKGCSIPAGQLEWGAGPAREEFEIAVLSPDEMILVQNMYDAAWATDWGGSTHWCFVRDGVQ